MECGRANNPTEIEDTFGCLIVVANFSEIEKAEQTIRSLYGKPAERRPRKASETGKPPTDFRFDDLRLYLRYPNREAGPPAGVEGVLFEVQIRTFLQHALSIATHDTVYKTDQFNWRRERIAAQIKAVLEQAELTIAMIPTLEQSEMLPLTTREYRRSNDLIAKLREHWEPDQLPSNVRLLASGIDDVLRNMNLSVSKFAEVLREGRARYGGTHNLNWSPYRAMLMYLAEQEPEALKQALMGEERGRIFVYPEVLAALGLSSSDGRRATHLRAE